MSWAAANLWLIPALPLAAAAILSVTRRPHRRLAAALSIGAMSIAFLLALIAFIGSLGGHGEHVVHNFDWLALGSTTVKLGWVLDPLSAVMLLMVTFVGTHSLIDARDGWTLPEFA